MSEGNQRGVLSGACTLDRTFCSLTAACVIIAPQLVFVRPLHGETEELEIERGPAGRSFRSGSRLQLIQTDLSQKAPEYLEPSP